MVCRISTEISYQASQSDFVCFRQMKQVTVFVVESLFPTSPLFFTLNTSHIYDRLGNGVDDDCCLLTDYTLKQLYYNIACVWLLWMLLIFQDLTIYLSCGHCSKVEFVWQLHQKTQNSNSSFIQVQTHLSLTMFFFFQNSWIILNNCKEMRLFCWKTLLLILGFNFILDYLWLVSPNCATPLMKQVGHA